MTDGRGLASNRDQKSFSDNLVTDVAIHLTAIRLLRRWQQYSLLIERRLLIVFPCYSYPSTGILDRVAYFSREILDKSRYRGALLESAARGRNTTYTT